MMPPEGAVVETTVAAVTKTQPEKGPRARSDAVVLTADNFNDYVDKREGKKQAPKPEAKEEAAKEEKPAAKVEAKKEEIEEEIDHPDEEKRGKLNERFSDITKARKAAEAGRDAEAKRAKEATERAEKAERDAQALRAKYEPPKGDDIGPEPQPEQFADAKEYGKALKDWTAESVRVEDAKKNRAVKAEKEHAERVAQWKDGEAALRLEMPDYDKRISESAVVLSDEARDAIVDEGPLGPRILMHLAENPELAARLREMTVGRMMKKIGELAAEVRKTVKADAKAEAKAATQHTAAEISRAPAPISPLNGGGDPVVRLGGHQEFHGSYEEYKSKRQRGQIK